MNWFSISSQRRTENKGISILLLIETSLTFVKSHSKSNNKYRKDEIIQTLDLLIDNIFVLFSGRVFQTNYWYSKGYELCSITRRFVSTRLWGRLLSRASQELDRKLAQKFNSSIRYIDDLLSLNNSLFVNEDIGNSKSIART
jgi:transcriptional regulator of heat shock response